jgi:hypothetical protein
MAQDPLGDLRHVEREDPDVFRDGIAFADGLGRFAELRIRMPSGEAGGRHAGHRGAIVGYDDDVRHSDAPRSRMSVRSIREGGDRRALPPALDGRVLAKCRTGGCRPEDAARRLHPVAAVKPHAKHEPLQAPMESRHPDNHPQRRSTRAAFGLRGRPSARAAGPCPSRLHSTRMVG